MQHISIEVSDTIGLSKREKALLQNTIMNFSAMTSALIVKKDMVLNPLESDELGVTIMYAEVIDDMIAQEMKQSLENRFANFFSMSQVELKAHIKGH